MSLNIAKNCREISEEKIVVWENYRSTEWEFFKFRFIVLKSVIIFVEIFLFSDMHSETHFLGQKSQRMAYNDQ